MFSLVRIFCILLFLAACSPGGSPGGDSVSVAIPTFSVSLKIVGENGEPVPGATVAAKGVTLPADVQGAVQITRLSGPLLATASAPGHLAEPVVAGWEDEGKVLTIRLLSAKEGRWVMHSGGDMMLGRRYQAPVEGAPLVPLDNAAEGARDVVKDVAQAFALGDVSTVNLETAVSDLPSSAAYPGKRFLLNSPPAAMSALKELGVDVAFLANNHTRDYGEEGLRRTMAALDGQGVKYQGASDVEAAAYEPLVVSVKGVRVGMLSWTSVTGTVVNDSYPVDGDPVPANLPADEAWQYQPRSWGYAGLNVPVASRRIGSAWRLFRDGESSLTELERAAAWASLSAVYPELQDWVARRGHGGGAMWRDSQSPAAIAALKQQADLAVVQLHSGYQYAAVPSDTLRENAHAAIDAGADIVICHHPHVTQGFEWYKGRLIAYSLGNFVFDQDFLATFSGFFLRTVWDGSTLVEARLVPTVLSAYRPVPTSGAASLRTALDVWEKCLLGAEFRRDPADDVTKTIEIDQVADAVAAHVIRNGSSYLITAQVPPRLPVDMVLSPGASAPVTFEGLIDSRLGLTPGSAAGLLIGRDLFGWGRFEDETADASADGSTHWTTDGTRKEVVFGDAAQGRGFLRLTRYSTSDTLVLVRPVARVPLQQHRLYRSINGEIVPADPTATYTLRFMARISAPAEAKVNFQSFRFDDTDPTADPTSTVLAQQTVAIQIASGGTWQPVEIAIPPALLATGGITANQILFYIQLFPPTLGKAMLDIDELELIEWRSASEMPARFGAFSRVKNTGNASVSLHFDGMPIER